MTGTAHSPAAGYSITEPSPGDPEATLGYADVWPVDHERLVYG